MSGVVQDLRTEEAADKLPQVPVSIVYSGIEGPAQASDEWDMDTQFSTGMAGGVSHLTIYSATTLTDSDLARAFNKFASQDVARAGSASFGECEYQAYLDGSMVAWDQVFAEAAAQGQTVFASSGDTGGFCNRSRPTTASRPACRTSTIPRRRRTSSRPAARRS